MKETDFSVLLESTITDRAKRIYKEILNTDYKALNSAQKKKYKNLTQRELNAVIVQINRAVSTL